MKISSTLIEKRLQLARQHLSEWQTHFTDVIKARREISYRHRTEINQLRSHDFSFREQSALLQQQVRELNRLKSANEQRQQAIREHQNQEIDALQQPDPDQS
ncbi:hypothetical protein [Spirosoma koreense]